MKKLFLTAVRNTVKTNFFTNPLNVLLGLAVSIFITETAFLLVVQNIFQLTLSTAMFVNSLLVTIIVVPVLYYLVVRCITASLTGKSEESSQAGFNEGSFDSADSFMFGKLMLQKRQDWEYAFDNIPDLITIHDKNFNIVKANRAAIEKLKLPPLKANKGLKCYQYYHAKMAPPDNCPSCSCMKTQTPVTFEINEPYLESCLEIMAMPMFDHNNNFSGIMHIARNVTEHRRAKDKIQVQLNRLNVLHSIEKSVTSSIDLRTTLDHCVEQITTQLGIDAASILLLERQTQTLFYMVSKGFRSRALKFTHLKLGESNAGRAAMKRQIVQIKNLMEEPGNFKRSKLFAEEEFISYVGIPLIAKGEVKGVMELFHRSAVETDNEWLDFLDTVSDQMAIAIDNSSLFDNLQQSNIELSLAYESTIEGWSRILDMRDKATEGHSQRVTDMTLRIAKNMGVKDSEFVHMRRGALLHDIGKMAVPDSILLKPGKLVEDEWTIMKRHTKYAFDMLLKIDYLKPAIDIPYYHHERWDGTGYPKGLKGKQIPLPARIFTVVDVWDALSNDRPYRAAWARESVLEYIISLSGVHFDPEVVDIFLQLEHQNI